MRTSECAALTITAIVCAVSASAYAQSEVSTPLKEAVAAFNERADEYFLKYQSQPSIFTKGQFPKTPLTEDEVVGAIRGWDRQKDQVDDTTYRIYQKIAETKVLPPAGELTFNFQWYHFAESDEHEFLVWWIDLEVMTGKNTGYGFRIRDERLDRRTAFLPSPGYAWIVEPREMDIPSILRPTMKARNGVTLETRSDEKGALIVTAALLEREGMYDWRLVAFDQAANRHILDRATSANSGNLTMVRFRLDPAVLPGDKVKHLGLEAVSSAKLEAVSERAVGRAKEMAIEILPWPQPGRPYEFTLTNTDGQVIDSRKMRGKVLLIDCWASWCGPCMAKMPKLKKIYDEWHGKGLEVLCLSFDTDVEASKAAFKLHNIPWPMVFVPNDREVRQLWQEAVRVPPIPRLLLIDRQGILNSNINVSPESDQALEDQITALLQGSAVEKDEPPQK